MENSMLSRWPIDPAVVIISLGIITLLLLIITIICILQTNKLYRRYDYFMRGNLSFAIALLDLNNTGFILNSVHSREGCYLYIKSVEKGETDISLGIEEKEALEQALGY